MPGIIDVYFGQLGNSILENVGRLDSSVRTTSTLRPELSMRGRAPPNFPRIQILKMLIDVIYLEINTVLCIALFPPPVKDPLFI